ncbi:hypothetical protein NC652_009903 [Populus alba x Populus x berolinensis]|nr:hypothetical protein NC652_009903 [Populus alba x Populus x berolinensis]
MILLYKSDPSLNLHVWPATWLTPRVNVESYTLSPSDGTFEVKLKNSCYVHFDEVVYYGSISEELPAKQFEVVPACKRKVGGLRAELESMWKLRNFGEYGVSGYFRWKQTKSSHVLPAYFEVLEHNL